MVSQKHLFQLPGDIHYLNCAYISPLMAAVEEAGVIAMRKKRNPAAILPRGFFDESEHAREMFGTIINCNPIQVAVIPSASYGLSAAVNNIPVNKGTHAITISDEFPSGFYAISEWSKIHNKELKIIQAPQIGEYRGKRWTERIIEAINKDTAAVVMSSISWSDGTKFNLVKIGERCRATSTLFIVDGTQSVGALPIDVKECNIDALVCAGYKWLLGPYSISLAYYGQQFDTGRPLENSWLNRSNAEDFANLTAYSDGYKPGAARYNAGQYNNFIQAPMLNKALRQILDWQVSSIQEYCSTLIQPLLQFLKEKEYWVEDAEYRASHLFGFALPKTVDSAQLLKELQEKRIYVSIRTNAVRIAPHVYNTAGDIEALIEALK